MKKQLWQWGVRLSAILCCVFLGYYVGYCKAEGITLRSTFSRVSQQKEEKVTYQKTIAIVNLDEGTKNQENYGSKMIETISDDVIVTGLEDARRGLELGRYSAYFIIPGSFSENVASVSSKPVKPILSYKLGRELEGKEREMVSERLNSIFQLFSSNLSKVYLASIMDTYHNTQDSASGIISNDTRDMELLLGVRGEDLVESIRVPEVTIVENTVSGLDLSGNYEQVHASVKNIDDAYKTGYDLGEQELTAMQQEFNAVGEQAGALRMELEATGVSIQMVVDNPWDDTEKAKEEDATYEQLSQELLESLPEYSQEVLTVFVEKLEQDGATLPEDMEQYIKEFLGIEEEEPEPSVDSPIEPPVIDTTMISDKLTALVTAAEDSRDMRNNEIKQRTESWLPILEQLQMQLTAYDGIYMALADVNARVGAFDMASYLDEAEIQGQVRNIDDSLYEMETKVIENVTGYREYAWDVYEATRKDMEAFAQSIEEGQEKSEQKLFTGLKEAKASREENNQRNLAALNTMITQLPYTRLGEVENREVYDFIANPIIIDNQSETN